jgi:hypothetical protein
MKKLLLTSAALFVMTTACSADRIQPFVGVNPTSGAGSFANTDPGTGAGGSGLFVDLYPFTLAGTQVLTIAFATNTFLMLGGFILVGYQITGYLVTR